MHVAVCDDNVADRKQMERLLGRESDRRLKETGSGLYVASYGNANAALSQPLLYDVFYIDMCKTPGITGADVARELISLGVEVPIYMCISDMDYRLDNLPEQVRYLDKAIRVADLAASLDVAQAFKDSRIPHIELRVEKETIYVTEDDILYAEEDERCITVVLRDGRKINIRDTVLNLFSQWEHYETFFAPTERILINGRYIRHISLFKLVMEDGHDFPLPFGARKYAKMMFEKYSQK